MSGTNVTLQHDQQYFTGSSAGPLQGKALLRAVQNEIAGILSGAKSCSAFEIAPNGADPLPAAAVTVVGGTGAQAAVIGGVTVSVSQGASATATATSLVTAINASSNALLTKVVQAGNLGATLTVSAIAVGDSVSLLGVTLTGVASNPTSSVNQFVATPLDDDATAAALNACINAHPVLSRYVRGSVTSAVVTVMCLTAAFPTGPKAPPNVVLALGSGGIVASGAVLAARVNVIVSTFRRDVIGNHITIAVTGTGASVLNSNTRLVGGAGGAVTSLLAYP